MSDAPSFLPAILDTRGSWETILATLYAVFASDFKEHTTLHHTFPVRFDSRILPDGERKEEGFWHVISRVDRESGQRLPDYRRAERLPWARPMLEAIQRDEIRVFDYDHGSKDKGVRRYVWLHGYDYVLVLARKKEFYLWLTAYFVDSQNRRIDLERRFARRAN